MNAYVLGFQEIDKTKLMVVGGKGASNPEKNENRPFRKPCEQEPIFCIVPRN